MQLCFEPRIVFLNLALHGVCILTFKDDSRRWWEMLVWTGQMLPCDFALLQESESTGNHPHRSIPSLYPRFWSQIPPWPLSAWARLWTKPSLASSGLNQNLTLAIGRRPLSPGATLARSWSSKGRGGNLRPRGRKKGSFPEGSAKKRPCFWCLFFCSKHYPYWSGQS